jgi:hypothetical protein
MWPVRVIAEDEAARAMPKSVTFTSPEPGDEDVVGLYVAVYHVSIVGRPQCSAICKR